MRGARRYDFGAFRMDPAERVLLRDGRRLPLTPKAFDVLRVLVERRGRLVTKEELLRAVWPDTVVEEGNLAFTVSILRRSLGRAARRYIETVPRHGYRFTPLVTETSVQDRGAAGSTARPDPLVRHIVGRDAQRAELRTAFQRVEAGHGLLLCVTGEPGVGKTTLVEDFLDEVARDAPLSGVARGRCSERLAGGDTYLPVLEALESLCASGEAGEGALRVMRVVAPSWSRRVVFPAGDPGASQPGSPSLVSEERLKRELGALARELSARRPLILFLDDLQWADASTADLLAYLGGKLHATRLLLIACYRASELAHRRHPLVSVIRDVLGRGLGHEIPLGQLGRQDVETYLSLRFPGHRLPADFAALLHDRTEGHPLFMVDLLHYLADRGVLACVDRHWTVAERLPEASRELPESVRNIIQRKLELLGEEDRRLLVAASVQGDEFDSQTLARVMGLDAGDVEERLDRLEQFHALVRRSHETELPDGTLTERYRFAHGVYQDVLYRSLAPGRRGSLSTAVAEAILAHHGGHDAAVAATVANLLETARDARRASRFFSLAAEHALGVGAHADATALVRRGLSCLATLPDTPERARQELALQTTLGLASMAIGGWAAVAVEEAYVRAGALCERLGERSRHFPVRSGLWHVYVVRARLRDAHDVATDLWQLAEREGSAELLGHAHRSLGVTLMDLGDLTRALGHLEEATARADAAREPAWAALSALDPAVACRCYSARVLWPLGYPDRARDRIDEALALAETRRDFHSLAFALTFASIIHHFRGEAALAQARAERAMALSAEHGLRQTLVGATMRRGWALADQGRRGDGIALMREGLCAFRAMHIEINRPQFLAVLADALRGEGQFDQGLELVAEALATLESRDERYYEPEVYRLRGRLLLEGACGTTGDQADEAEAWFRRAIALAGRMQARSWELRAAMDLGRLEARRGRPAGAREMLAAVYGWFTEGLDTRDLVQARALLDDLAGPPEPLRCPAGPRTSADGPAQGSGALHARGPIRAGRRPPHE